MDPTHLFELVIGMFVAIIALNYAANRLGLPPSVALLAGGALLAFVPGLPSIEIDPGLVLVGGALIGIAVGTAWVLFVRRLGDEYLMIAATVLLSSTSYLLGETLHVSGVIATVTTGMIANWHQHTVLSASTRMRGTSFWAVTVFLMEAAVFILIGLSLRGVVDRGGGFGVVIATMGGPILVILLALTLARFAWVFGSDIVIRLCNAAGLDKHTPLGARSAAIVSWAGVRGVVTLALALSVPEGYPGRDFILVTSFAVIVGTVLVQGTKLGRLIAWARPVEPASEKPPLRLSQAEAEMAKAQLVTVQKLAYDGEGKLIHPQLLERYQRRAVSIVDYAARTEDYLPVLHAHFDLVLEAVATGRQELIRLHRAGDIDDETMLELERDLDLEELSALSAKA